MLDKDTLELTVKTVKNEAIVSLWSSILPPTIYGSRMSVSSPPCTRADASPPSDLKRRRVSSVRFESPRRLLRRWFRARSARVTRLSVRTRPGRRAGPCCAVLTVGWAGSLRSDRRMGWGRRSTGTCGTASTVTSNSTSSSCAKSHWRCAESPLPVQALDSRLALLTRRTE
eukprot:1190261-Prorocentrum_minimum.AAC.3